MRTLPGQSRGLQSRDRDSTPNIDYEKAQKTGQEIECHRIPKAPAGNNKEKEEIDKSIIEKLDRYRFNYFFGKENLENLKGFEMSEIKPFADFAGTQTETFGTNTPHPSNEGYKQFGMRLAAWIQSIR